MDGSGFTTRLGKRIKQAREEKDITQEQLAEQIGISRTAIARYELGEIEPKLKNLCAIARQLDVSTDYLLGLDSKDSFEVLKMSEEAIQALEKFIKEIRKN